MADNVVGYVLVSQVVHGSVFNSCGRHGCVSWDKKCPYPERPRGSTAVCVPSRSALLAGPDKQYAEALAQYHREHYHEEPTGGTRLGPLHYFHDCHTLLKRGGARRKDARIIGVTIEMISLLQLPVCKQCYAKIAEMETTSVLEVQHA